MSKKVLSILIIFFHLGMQAQMLPLSDHYDINALSINPAVAGNHEALSLTLSCRSQWTGFDDAPKTRFFSAHAPILNDRVGLGLMVESNRIGIFNETSVMGNYAYRTELYPGTFCLGLGFGLSAFRDAWNDLKPLDRDDDVLITDRASAILPAFSLGSYFYTPKYFIGFSLPFFLSPTIDKSTSKYRLKNVPSDYNYFITGGYEIGLSEGLNIQPSILVRLHQGDPARIDYNVRFGLRDKVRLGMGFRNGDMFISSIQCQINYQILIGYSHDFNIGEIAKHLNNSHEFVLCYIFRYERNVVGPRNF